MAKFQLKIKKSAEKELNQLQVPTVIKIKQIVIDLADNPFPSGYKKLKGYKNLYRVRYGDYRIIYAIYQDIITIEILKIGHGKIFMIDMY